MAWRAPKIVTIAGGLEINLYACAVATSFAALLPAGGARAQGATVTLPEIREANLNWNVAVGMVRPDERLRDAINGALERLRADGTVDRIYRRYGIVLRPPR